MSTNIIFPDWPAPPSVQAVITTRIGGVSECPYYSFNLATHVGDSEACVQRNRRLLSERLALPAEPQWLNQTHGIRIVPAQNDGVVRDADGSYSQHPNQICLVQTADCLPILLCNQEGSEVAALHAGWRGLAAGIVSEGVQRFSSAKLLAYLGPAISQSNFEVGVDVVRAFTEQAGNWESRQEIINCFQQKGPQHWLADLYALARLALKAAGVRLVYGGNYCTYSDSEHFFSFRRDGETGRIASLIWVE
ncbi:MAG: peptidoglycan editing factor PgeF [Porticoccaceae bacterium]|nr:peptidoglycan editing factor PgeF [Pseudomonadales bacterium]